MDYTKIKTYEAACAYLGKDHRAELPWQNPIDADQENDNDIKRLKIIAKALKGDHIPNWNDRKEYKWFPVFRNDPTSGFGFSDSLTFFGDAGTTVGSRFVFPTEEISDFYATQFFDIHKRVLIFN